MSEDGQAINYESKVLVVDDNDINAAVMIHFLTHYHCDVHRVHNGKEAFEYTKRNKLDIVFMDINMPILNGCEASILIRQDSQIEQPKIIAVTADATRQTQKNCFDAGMDDFLAKPYSFDRLKQIVAGLLTAVN